jgi:hypothetical protein
MDREDDDVMKREPLPQPAPTGAPSDQSPMQSAVPATPASGGPTTTLRHYTQIIGLALVTGGIVAGVMIYLRGSVPNCDAQGIKEGSKRELFHDWGTPDLALMLTGQMHGYLQPCGCSSPQYGGMARRYNFLASLRERGWPVVSVDVGDIAQRSGPQAMLKYSTAMQALQLMGYTAIALGKNEMDMPLIDALSNFALNNSAPRVLAANLLDPGGKVLQGMVRSWEIAGKDGMLKVGVVGLSGPSVAKKVKDASVHFADSNSTVLTTALAELRAKKVDVVVLLYEGSVKEAKACAEFWAESRKTDATLLPIHVIQCLSEEEEPPSVPERAGNSMILTVGHKGRYVGVVGIFRSDKAERPFDLRYQLVSIGPEYKTPEGKEAMNPLMKVMEEYSKELKDRDYLARFPRTAHPMQLQYPNAKYVGSERCADCHERPYEVWKASRHASAYKALVEARRPALRQFDGECVVCHVVGFSHPSGYYDRGITKAKNELLQNVGCESCHGPASVHVNDPTNAALYPLLNPWKAPPGESEAAAKARGLRIDLFCQKCHDVDNDVHWNFEKNWPQIVHPTPRKAAAGQ